MKKHLHKLILFSATACLSACTAQEPLTDYVDPRIGTAHSRWFFFTGRRQHKTVLVPLQVTL